MNEIYINLTVAEQIRLLTCIKATRPSRQGNPSAASTLRHRVMTTDSALALITSVVAGPISAAICNGGRVYPPWHSFA
jgi:hypothetical protein